MARTRASSASSRRARLTIPPITRVKILVLGDSGVGKTCLIHRHRFTCSCLNHLSSSSEDTYPSDTQFISTYIPTTGVELHISPPVSSKRHPQPSNTSTNARINTIYPSFFDFSGDDAYSKIRSEFYNDYHAILLCYDVSNKLSYENLSNKWISEIRSNITNPQLFSSSTSSLPCVLVACKCDTSSGRRVVDEKTGRKFASSCGFQYFETSAKTNVGVDKVVEAVIELAASHSQSTSSSGSNSSSSTESNHRSSFDTRPSSASTTSPRPPPSSSSSTSSSSSSSSSYSSNKKSPSEMSAGEIQRELSALGINYSDCIEKSELIHRLQQVLAGTYKKVVETEEEPSSLYSTSSSSRTSTTGGSTTGTQVSNEALREKILSEVSQWSQGKDLRLMLNDLHGARRSDDTNNNYLERNATLPQVEKSYKKVLLKIHPDKVDPNQREAHMKATEMFKMVNAAMEAYKKQMEKLPTAPQHPQEADKSGTASQRFARTASSSFTAASANNSKRRSN